MELYRGCLDCGIGYGEPKRMSVFCLKKDCRECVVYLFWKEEYDGKIGLFDKNGRVMILKGEVLDKNG